MRTRDYRFWRRMAGAAEAVLLLGLPFLRIRGESALRFDVPSLRLHFFGMRIWMDEFLLVLAATLFLVALFLLVTLLFGRVWCGWLCPQTVLCDFTAIIDRTRKMSFPGRVPAYLFTLLLSAVVGASIVWYFVSPYTFIPELVSGSLGPVPFWSWIVLSSLALANFSLLRRSWCVGACPYAKLQGALFDSHTLVIAYDSRRNVECMDCRACAQTCPAGIDIRNGLNVACISCAACVDACAERMGRRSRTTLIDYCFGAPGAERKLMRQNAVLAGSATLLACAFLLMLVFSRKPADMMILPRHGILPQTSPSGDLINAYTISISNRGDTPLAFSLSVGAGSGSFSVMPDRIAVPAAEEKKTMISVRLHGQTELRLPASITVTARAGGEDPLLLEEPVLFQGQVTP